MLYGDDAFVRKRFPRIPHVVNGPLRGGGVTRDDIVLSDADARDFLDIENLISTNGKNNSSKNVTVSVQEKIDGANLGLSYSTREGFVMQNRSHRVCVNSASQWKGLERLLERSGNEIIALLYELESNAQIRSLVGASAAADVENQKPNVNRNQDDNDDDAHHNNMEKESETPSSSSSDITSWTLYGEFCYARHSVAYTKLPSTFLAFDLYHAPSDTFISVALMRKLMEKHCPSVPCVPLLQTWTFTGSSSAVCAAADSSSAASTGSAKRDDDNSKLSWDSVHAVYHGKPSAFNSDVCCEGAMIRVDCNGKLVRRCKAVHDAFRQEIDDHWTAKEMIKNGIVVFE